MKITLVVKNPGLIDAPRPAVITGAQDGVEIYSSGVFDVFDAVGNGRTKFPLNLVPSVDFPAVVPDVDIVWTVDIFDDDPDPDAGPDTATAISRVVP